MREALGGSGLGPFSLLMKQKLEPVPRTKKWGMKSWSGLITAAFFASAAIFSSNSSDAAEAGFQLLSGELKPSAKGLSSGTTTAVLRLKNGGVIEVLPHSEIRIQGAPVPMWLAELGKIQAQYVYLFEGGIRLSETERSREEATKWSTVLSTPCKQAILALDATLESTVDGKSCSLAVHHHESLVLEGKTLSSVGEGAWRKINASGEVRSGKMLSSPKFISEKDLYVAGNDGTSIELDWTGLPGASAYSVRLNSSTGKHLEMRVTESQVRIPNVLPGIYQAEVLAIDTAGISGTLSQAKQIQVIGVDAPSGGYVDANGAVRLGKSHRAKFTHAEGVVMVFGNGSDWQPAEQLVGMLREEITTLHLRRLNSSELTTVRLMPRGLAAEVKFKDKSPSWPGKALQFEIAISADGGSQDASWIEANIHAKSGIDTISVKSRREGDKIIGEIPVQAGKGPWVVRLEVTDQYDLPIGRGFVEVAHR